MTDNKEDKFFYFPMISMPCTGSGYELSSKPIAKPLKIRDLAIFLFSNFPTFSPHLQVFVQSDSHFPH